MTLSPHDILQLLLTVTWRRRYLICVPFLIMIPLSLVGARWVPKTYEAKTILLLQETGKKDLLGAHRPAMLYQFKKMEITFLN